MARLEPEERQPGVGLDAFARRVRTLGEFDDPAIEAALEQGIREQVTAKTERAEQAAGLTGASQTALGGFARAASLAEAAVAAQTQRLQRQASLLELEQRAIAQSGQLNEQRYKTNLQHQQFLDQMRAQKSQQKSALAGALGGAIVTAVSGGALAGLGATMAAGGAAAGDIAGDAASQASALGAMPNLAEGFLNAPNSTTGYFNQFAPFQRGPLGNLSSFLG